MRKILLFVFALVLTGCSMSNDEKVHKLIEASLKEYANDPSSIEIISIDTLEADSASRFEGTIAYSHLMAEIESSQKFADELNFDKESYDIAMEDVRELQKELEECRRTFKPFFFWRTKVAYRGKNSFGALVRNTARVKFDKELTQIVEFKAEGE